jgi:hypothetical protein
VRERVEARTPQLDHRPVPQVDAVGEPPQPHRRSRGERRREAARATRTGRTRVRQRAASER